MNTETGRIETIDPATALQRRLDGMPKYIPVARTPNVLCKRCNGTGSRRRGTKRNGIYVPCRCVL